jgi:predicted ester cyclase
MDRILDEHFGYEAQDDIEGVVNTLTEDVEHDVVGSPGSQITGRDAARAYYEDLFRDLKGESAETVRRLYGEDFMVDETLWTGRASGRPFGLPGGERRVSFRLLHVLEFRDGKISRENVWVDGASLLKQLA